MGKCSVYLQVAIICTSDDYLTRYFVYISGEHINAAKAEVNTLARILGIDETFYWEGRVGLVDSQINLVQFFLERAALVKETGIILSESDIQDDLLGSLSDDMLKDIVGPEETFSVRTISENREYSVNERLNIEARLGAYIRRVAGARVDLEDPQTRILVIFGQDNIRVCRSFASKLRPMLRDREPGKKPFFHPSMMNSALARVMCNLARVMPDEIMLDPFCGGGGILCEASLIGARTIGIDLSWRLLTGCKENLSSITSNYSVIQGDIRNLPIDGCDCIITDPPYGKASSTRGAKSIGLVEALFGKVDSILHRRNESICICGSKEMNLYDLAQSMGLIVNQVLQIRVHSGLVREVLALSV
jgi:putative methyltransferase (TIGR01177 family)